jgi:hypothetical protein
MATHVDTSDQNLLFRFEGGIWQVMYYWDRPSPSNDENIWVKIDHRYGPCVGETVRHVSIGALRMISDMEVIAAAADS